MKKTSTEPFFHKFRARFTEGESDRAVVLFVIQVTLILLMCATHVLVLLTNTGWRLVLYVSILGFLLALFIAALRLILLGKFKISAFLTVLATIIGPWLSILFDTYIKQGDFVPLIFISLSIQLCAIFLSEKTTIAIAAAQLILLVAYIITNPNMLKIDWPSLVLYITFTATLGIVTSFMNRKQYERLERHRERLKENEAELRILADRDALTGLYNRRFMEQAMDREIEKAGRRKKSIGIIMSDVDDFKSINDTYGHLIGDYVLRRISEVIIANIRSSDIACRFGGDEFLLILPNASLEIAQKRADRLDMVLKNTPFIYENRNIGTVGMSFGVAAFPDHGLEQDKIIKYADGDLYIAKKKNTLHS
jgi:diguanylate cyclase (GGDEF) domain